MPYSVTPTAIPDVLILEPRVFADERGFFMESFNARDFERATGERREFVQDNHSLSRRGVLRGLHYQLPNAQGKLVRVTRGEVYDVAVDLRRDSATFGKHAAAVLSEQNKRQLWIPEGFAHGFLVTSEWAEFMYKTTAYYDPTAERTIRWNDETLAVPWPLDGEPVLTARDARGYSFAEAPTF